MGNRIYVGADTGNFTPVTALGGFLHAVQPEDGKRAWTYDATAPIVGVASADNGSSLIVTTMDGYLHAVRSSDGKQMWRVQGSHPSNPQRWFPHTLFGPVGAPVMSRDGKSVYFFASNGLAAFNASSGEQMWFDKE